MPTLMQQFLANCRKTVDYKRDQERTDFDELKRIVEAHGSAWVEWNLEDIVAEIEDKLDDDETGINVALDNRMRAEDYR